MKQQVNLYLPEFRRRKDPLGAVNMLKILGGVAGLFALLSAWQHWELHRLDTQLDARRAALAESVEETARLAERLGAQSPDEGLAESVRRLEEGLQGKKVLLGFLESRNLGNATGFSEHMADLSRFLVPGLRLTRVDLREGGEQVHLGGEVSRPENVPLYLQSLSRGHSYDGKSFETLRIGSASGEDADGVLSFEVATRAEGQ